eukprot:5089805-Pyramimonas_sp.AAC.1
MNSVEFPYCDFIPAKIAWGWSRPTHQGADRAAVGGGYRLAHEDDPMSTTYIKYFTAHWMCSQCIATTIINNLSTLATTDYSNGSFGSVASRPSGCAAGGGAAAAAIPKGFQELLPDPLPR